MPLGPGPPHPRSFAHECLRQLGGRGEFPHDRNFFARRLTANHRLVIRLSAEGKISRRRHPCGKLRSFGAEPQGLEGESGIYVSGINFSRVPVCSPRNENRSFCSWSWDFTPVSCLRQPSRPIPEVTRIGIQPAFRIIHICRQWNISP